MAAKKAVAPLKKKVPVLKTLYLCFDPQQEEDAILTYDKTELKYYPYYFTIKVPNAEKKPTTNLGIITLD